MFSLAKFTKVRVMAFGTMSIISPIFDLDSASALTCMAFTTRLTFHNGEV